MPIVRIALDVPLPGLFDYSCEQVIAIGQRVIVPFGKRKMVGLVLECVDTSDLASDRIKSVLHVPADVAPLSPELIKLLRFCSDYYHYPVGQTFLSALPTRLRSVRPIDRKPVFDYRLSPAGENLDIETLSKRKIVQRRILESLSEGSRSLAQLKNLSSTAGKQLNLLIEAGYVEHRVALPVIGKHKLVSAHTLTAEQQQAMNTIIATVGYACFLLHGITGSGKTEVYVHLMHEALQQGKQVLLLVPEINLTPQLEQYFRSRFPVTEFASLHSGLSEGERLHNWQQAQAGTAQIVLGTRLAVFTELPKLALIIVDEEHDTSFKQQDGLRYSARDVAIFRAKQRDVPIVLGSATPSLESYHNAQNGRYRMLRLTGRAQVCAKLPAVRCVNINQTVMHHGISENLLREIEQRIIGKEQSLLFINRRGYAPVLMCTSCGWLSGCKHCAGKMVLHLNDKRLRCHHCGYQIRMPHACPECGTADLHPVGSGTQRIEAVLQERFPEARILRVDRDSTRNKRAWRTMREQIHANEVDILVGTQMLAKGHDFPALTLVGVLNPDSALYSSDFRAPEKLFAQLVQVSGRAGRSDKPGEVIIQTSFPDHPLFRSLQAYDFDGWAASQITERQMAGFPPFMFQAVLRTEGKQEPEVYDYLNQARMAATKLKFNIEVLGVVPAPLPRRANHFRAQLLLQCATRKEMQQFLRAWKLELDVLAAPKLRCTLDIDPLDF